MLSVINDIAKKESLIKTPRAIFNWSLTRGLYSDIEQGKDETKSPLKVLEFIENYDKPSIFVLKDFHIYFGGQGRVPDFQVIRKIRDIIPVVKQSQKPKNIIFLSSSLVLPNDLHPKTDLEI